MEEYLKYSDIMISTLNTCGNHNYLKHLSNRVSCLIIDEAGQATEPSTLIPLQTMTKKVVLVGDHKQLQPTVMSQNCQVTKYSTSLMERLGNAGFKG